MKLFILILSLLFASEIEKFFEQKNINVSIPEIDELATEKIMVLRIGKKCDSASTFWNEYSSKCESWLLNKENVVQIIRSRKRLNKFDFSYFYEVLPCSYEGVVLINNNEYNFEINSGSFLILSQNDAYWYFDCSHKSVRKYFILKPATPKTL